MDYRAEPYRIKMVEPIKQLSRPQREKALEEAGYNLFALSSDQVYIDLLTDSGTGAMSQEQWAGMMKGDESYAGSRSYFRLEETAAEITGHEYILPAHQGRGAEQVLFPALMEENQYVINNMHFDTTRAHVELAGGRARNFVLDAAYDTETDHPFKGNMDTDKLEHFLQETPRSEVGFIIITVTCNSAGGQPVSLANMKEVKKIADRYGLPLVLDAARFAENAYFIKEREEGYRESSIAEIVQKMFSLADAFTLSAKKDAIVNIGGIIGVKEDEELYKQVRSRLVPLEGFPTYGGLAGRDLEALAVGLREGIDYDYLNHRIGQVAHLGEMLKERGVPIQSPAGGHAIFVDAGRMLPRIPYHQFPGQALANALYLEAGVRSVEIGSFLLGRDQDTGEQLEAPLELTRLTIPRRVYTDNHLQVVADALGNICEYADELTGLEFTYEPEILRHFTARLKPVTG